MTNAQAMQKVRSLMKSLRRDVVDECARLLASGAVDASEYENNFVLPRLLLYVALGNERHHWLMPHMTKDHKKVVRNLEAF